MEELIEQLKNTNNQEECIARAYDILSKKYHGSRVKTYLFIYRLLEKDIDKMWNRNGFLHCMSINMIMKNALIHSGYFSDEDIKIRWTSVWFLSPHQYLQIAVNQKIVNIDIWAKRYGIQYGDFAKGFK